MLQGRMGYCLDDRDSERTTGETAAARVRGERVRNMEMRVVRCIVEVGKRVLEWDVFVLEERLMRKLRFDS
jgi:hypothetical protein